MCVFDIMSWIPCFFLNITQQPLSFFFRNLAFREWPLVAWQGETSWASFAPRSGEPQIQQTQKDAKEIHLRIGVCIMWYTYLPLDLHQIYIKYIEYMASKTLERN